MTSAKRIGDGRRRNFIQPSLLHVSNDDISVGVGGKATRPPVVGRETALDPERTKRYSSQEEQLQEYLNALRKKTVEKNDDDDVRRVRETSLEGEKQKATDFVLQNNRNVNLFLKKKKEPIEVDGKNDDDVGKSTLRPSLSAGGRTLSAALQKAQFFTNKYAKVPPTLPANVEVNSNSLSEKIEKFAPQKQTLEQVEDRVSSSRGRDKEKDCSVSSIFNVKSFEDFTSEIDDVVSVENREKSRVTDGTEDEDETENQQETSESFKFQLRSLGDLEVTEVEEKPVLARDKSSVSSVDSFPSKRTGGELESDDYSYEDDFEGEGNQSLTSAAASESVEEAKIEMKPVSMQRKRLTLSRGVQTSLSEVGLGPDPNCLLFSQLNKSNVPTTSFVDPKRVSSYVVSPETLLVLSSYNPSLMALNELLRHQVNSTRAFVEAQRRSYVASITNLRPDYEYTTLEKTKTLILNHRKKRK